MSTSKEKKDEEPKAKEKSSPFIGVLIVVLYYWRIFFDWLVDQIFFYFYKDRMNQRIPPVKETFLELSAMALAERIREKKLTSEQVVRAYADRIKEVNTQLNAVVDERFEQAIKEAQSVDELIAKEDFDKEKMKKEKPFLGVPFTCKESTAAKGMAFTCGMFNRKGERAVEDAFVIERVKESGGILIACTNIPELNLWCETRNVVYGQTQNPYNFTRTAGGSSGGEASNLAACGSPIGIGTDIGGSGRMPAYYCGVYGHKTTTGIISTKGLTFMTGKEADTMVTAGPMARHAEDLLPLLKVLVGPETKGLTLDVPVDVTELKYYYIANPGDLRVSPISTVVRETMMKVVNHLTSTAKAPAEKIRLKGFKYSLALWRHAMTKEPSNFAFNLGNQKEEVSLATELPKLLMGTTNHTLPAIMRLCDLKILPKTNPEWAEKVTEELRKGLLDILGDNGVLLFPSSPNVAPYHYASFFRPYNFAYWAIFNVLKFPATQVPLGLSPSGLPTGIQIVAAPKKDHLCLAVASELEKTFGGWVPPYSKAGGV